MGKVNLSHLVEEITRILPEKRRISGTMTYEGEIGSRIDGKETTMNFSYKILKQEVQGSAKNYDGDDDFRRGEETWVERGIKTLEYPFKNNIPKINITKKRKTEANIEIIYTPQRIKKLPKNKRNIEKPNETKNTKNKKDFIETIYSFVIFPRKKEGYTLKIRGEIDKTKYYSIITTTLSSGFKNSMKDIRKFSEIYNPKNENEKNDESKYISNHLNFLTSEVQKLLKNRKNTVTKIAKGKTLETTLDKKGKTLILHPFR